MPATETKKLSRKKAPPEKKAARPSVNSCERSEIR